LDDRQYPGAEGTFVHPFDDDNFIAGHGTMALEILEDAPDTKAIIASIGGGGLITGVASAIKAIKPDIKIFGAEPETAAPAALPLAAALTGKAGKGPIVAIVSGGNIDMKKFFELIG